MRKKKADDWSLLLNSVYLLFVAILAVAYRFVYVTSGTNTALSFGTKLASFSDGLRYVCIIDAGSVGSRIHIFQFDTDQSRGSVVLVSEEVEEIFPGLSSFAEDPQEAAISLDPLLDKAMQVIPKEYYTSTPVSVKATPGLRLLGNEISEEILRHVRSRLQSYHPFRVEEVDVMDGKEEGVLAWISVNYLLGRLDRESDKKISTAAVFDLGGASTQLVFEPNFGKYTSEEAKAVLLDSDHRYNLKYGQHYHLLYQHSHLGYGLMEARKQIHKLVAERQVGRSFFSGELKLRNNSTLITPCIPPGKNQIVTIDVAKKRAKRSKYVDVLMVGSNDTDANSQCLQLAQLFLNTNKDCGSNHYGLNGVDQVSLMDTVEKKDLYIVSYFYDRTFPLAMPTSFPVSQLKNLTINVCNGPQSWINEYSDEVLDELEERPEWCLDLNFIFSMLHDGYGIPLDHEVKIAKQINDHVASWPLGAALQMMNNNIEVPEIFN